MVLHMGKDEVVDFSLERTCIYRVDVVSLKDGVGLHDGVRRKVRDLQCAVGDVDVGDKACQAAQCFNKKDSLLAGGYKLDLLFSPAQSFRSCKTSLKIFLSPRNGSQGELPGVCGLGILKVFVTGHEFGKVPVACCRNPAVAVEEVHLHSVHAFKDRVHPVVALCINACIEVLVDEAPVDREEIRPLIGSRCKPCEMVDAGNADNDVMPVFNLIACLGFVDAL